MLESDCVIAAPAVTLLVDALDVDVDKVESARADKPVGSDDFRFGALFNSKKEIAEIRNNRNKKVCLIRLGCVGLLRRRRRCGRCGRRRSMTELWRARLMR
jgi:hypothetical protein